MSRIRIYSPQGPIGSAARTLAAAPPVLTGLRLGVLENRKPNARLLLSELATRLAERTGARVALVTAKANAAVAAEADVLAQVRSTCDVVLTGSAD
jgi:hypothetical protein